MKEIQNVLFYFSHEMANLSNDIPYDKTFSYSLFSPYIVVPYYLTLYLLHTLQYHIILLSVQSIPCSTTLSYFLFSPYLQYHIILLSIHSIPCSTILSYSLFTPYLVVPGSQFRSLSSQQKRLRFLILLSLESNTCLDDLIKKQDFY